MSYVSSNGIDFFDWSWKKKVPELVTSNSVSLAAWLRKFWNHRLVYCLRSDEEENWEDTVLSWHSLFLPFHIHLLSNWNFLILFKLFILLLWDLISRAVALVKLLWQWVSNQKPFFFFLGQLMRALVLKYFRIFPSTIKFFLLLWNTVTRLVHLLSLKKKILRWFVLMMRKLWIRELRYFVQGNTLWAVLGLRFKPT